MSNEEPGPGRPPKIGSKEEAEILACLSVGASLNDAADYVGVHRTTLNRYKAENSNFAKGVDRAVAAGKIVLTTKIVNAKEWQSAAWMLERKWGAEFGKRDRLDVTSAGEQIGASFDPKRLTVEQLEELRRLVASGQPKDESP